jgi:glucose/arabinose dehydrogenase
MKTFSVIVGVILLATLIFFRPVQDFLSGILPLVRPAPPLPAGETLPFKVPEGFAVNLYADDVPGARVIVRDPAGVLVVSEPSEGKVVALPDDNSDGISDGAVMILQGLRKPHGLAFVCPDSAHCALYVAEEDAVNEYSYDASSKSATLVGKVADLPAGGGHSTRSLLPHPDGKHLLISVGSSCNVCGESDSRRAAVLTMEFISNKLGHFARGLRNTVFMAIHPVTGEIWGTEMGRDLLGDDLPPDELNVIREGGKYGWPVCYGKNIHDTDFDKNTYIRNPCMEPFETPSHVDIPAHSAPLGLAFVPEEGWPEDMWYDVLIAYHGSWNRSTPTGYKIVRIPLDSKGAPAGAPQDFMTGFTNQSGEVIGRPVGILAEPGGTVYVTDDRAGAVYRISRTSLD